MLCFVYTNKCTAKCRPSSGGAIPPGCPGPAVRPELEPEGGRLQPKTKLSTGAVRHNPHVPEEAAEACEVLVLENT